MHLIRAYYSSVRQAFHQIPGDAEFQLDPLVPREQINGASFCRMFIALFVLDDAVKKLTIKSLKNLLKNKCAYISPLVPLSYSQSVASPVPSFTILLLLSFSCLANPTISHQTTHSSSNRATVSRRRARETRADVEAIQLTPEELQQRFRITGTSTNVDEENLLLMMIEDVVDDDRSVVKGEEMMALL
uniref:Uncharacterized protein n=1 Tax=Meloidogyne incognita TaxID=6306 RepID=A0A914L2M2_MELIC